MQHKKLKEILLENKNTRYVVVDFTDIITDIQYTDDKLQRMFVKFLNILPNITFIKYKEYENKVYDKKNDRIYHYYNTIKIGGLYVNIDIFSNGLTYMDFRHTSIYWKFELPNFKKLNFLPIDPEKFFGYDCKAHIYYDDVDIKELPIIMPREILNIIRDYTVDVYTIYSNYKTIQGDLYKYANKILVYPINLTRKGYDYHII